MCSVERRKRLRRFAVKAWHPLDEKRFQERNGALCGTELALDELLSACSQCGSVLRIGKKASNKGFELFCVTHDDSCVGSGERGDDVAEVPGVGAERHGGSVCGGLDHVLAAAVAEA